MTAISSKVILENLKILFDDVPCLIDLEKIAINCVLLKSLDKLRIINKLLTTPYNEENNSIAIHKPNDINRITPPEDDVHENVIIALKIKTCLSFVIEALSNSNNEILVYGTQYNLPYITCSEDLKIYDNYVVRLEHNKRTKELSEQEEKFKKLKSEYFQACQHLAELAGPCLERAFTNTLVSEKIWEDYTLKLEKTKLDQHLLSTQIKEQIIYESTYKQGYERVQEKIHGDLQNHLLNCIEELTDKLNNWTDKYNTDLEKIDTEILKLRSKWDEAKSNIQRHHDKISEKQSLVMQLKMLKYNSVEEESSFKSSDLYHKTTL